MKKQYEGIKPSCIGYLAKVGVIINIDNPIIDYPCSPELMPGRFCYYIRDVRRKI